MPKTPRSWRPGLLAFVLVAAPLLLVHTLFFNRQIQAEAERLESVAAEAAAELDAEAHERIQGADDAASPDFFKLQNQLRLVAERRGVRSPMYTLRQGVDERGEPITRFVVMTNEAAFVGDPYELRAEMRPTLDHGERARTGLYADAHGAWISGYAPIRADDGRVVALVSADRASLDLLARRARGRIFILLGALAAGLAGASLPGLIQGSRSGPLRALRRLVTGKLSARIGLASGATVLVAVGIVAFNDHRLARQEQIEHVTQQLREAVALGALALDMGQHQAVVESGRADTMAFVMARHTLRQVKEAAGLRSPLYTLRRDGELTRFVVMTNEEPFVGDTHELRPGVARTLETGEVGSEGPYSDAHGHWISAWAPLYEGEAIVAVLQADYEVGGLMEALAERAAERGLFVMLGVCVAFGVGALLARGLARPIEDAAGAADRIQEGDFLVRLPEAREDEVGDLARSINRMARGLQEREQLRDMFGKYMATQVVSQLLEEGELSLEGELREVTVLLSDIRGYTALTEELGAEEVVSLLNEYFGILVDAVVQREGVIDKFMGDAMLCWFGAPVPQEDHRQRAMGAARDILERLGEWNAARVARGLEPVATGIGLATGCVVVGNIGSPQRLEYTAIGDAVNLASRLCSKADAGEILVTRSIQQVVEIPLEPMGPIQVKGVREPVEVHRLKIPIVAT